jgi:5-methylcytosine-specific restriction protein A
MGAMSLADLTPEAVRQAIAEYDQVGQDPFLGKYGFGKARGYFLVHDGQLYDSKAIAWVFRLWRTGIPFEGGQ